MEVISSLPACRA